METKRVFLFEITINVLALSTSFKYQCYVITVRGLTSEVRIWRKDSQILTSKIDRCTVRVKLIFSVQLCIFLNTYLLTHPTHSIWSDHWGQTVNNCPAWRHDICVLQRFPGWRVRCQHLVFDGMYVITHYIPANTTRRTNVGLILGQRRRRWPNIKPPLDQCVVFGRMAAAGRMDRERRRAQHIPSGSKYSEWDYSEPD